MAKKGGKRDGSKGTAIAAALKANPSATAKEILAIVKKGGVDVSLGMIAKVKGQLKSSGGGAKAKPTRKKAAKKKATKKKAKKATTKKAAPKRAAKKKAAPRKKAARRGRPAGGGPSMSDAIRAFMTANPGAGRAQVRDGLRAQGLDVKDSLVSAVYYKVKKSGGAPAKKRGPGRPKKAAPAAKAAPARAARAKGGLSASQLLEAKSLADKLGGIGNVREALNLIEKLS